MAERRTPVLELRGITKAFPGVLANDHIDLALYEGEILALLGENGAGKTTLMNVLYGLYAPDEGEILVRGAPTTIGSPTEAIALGIGMVHQHFMLVPPLTVAENVMLGSEPTRRSLFLDRRSAAARVSEIAEVYGLAVPTESRVADLPVGVQQRVEIVKVLYRNADILILDEPTAVLTPQEVEDLFAIIRSLVARGKSVIFITHKLGEVLSLADRIAVLRRGRMVGTALPDETDEASLAAMMVGRALDLKVAKEPAQPAEATLQVQDLMVLDRRRSLAVAGVSFDVRRGEIVGVAGVQGNGQTELIQALTGLVSPVAGRITICGVDTTAAAPRTITELDVAHIPEDRQLDGLVLAFCVADNLVLNTYYRPPFARGVLLQEAVIRDTADRLIREFDVRTPGADVPVANLSGGNQQKVIVAREFSRRTSLLVAAQPTRGLDVGSVQYIHRRIVERRDGGAAVLLISSELDEITELSDRILVMYRGRIMADVAADQVTREQLGLLMAGLPIEGMAGAAAEAASPTPA